MSDIAINYKGSSIATMDASGTKTLLTSGKYCEADITVVYTKPSGGVDGNNLEYGLTDGTQPLVGVAQVDYALSADSSVPTVGVGEADFAEI